MNILNDPGSAESCGEIQRRLKNNKMEETQ